MNGFKAEPCNYTLLPLVNRDETRLKGQCVVFLELMGRIMGLSKSVSKVISTLIGDTRKYNYSYLVYNPNC